MEGLFIGHPKGFGFVEIEGQEDVYISEEDTKQAVHQDRVRIRLKEKASGGQRMQGEVVKILEHTLTEVVGTFEKSKKYGFVIPDNTKFSKDIFISQENTNGAHHGDKVVVQLVHYGSKKKSPEGKITEILGNIREPGVDILAVVKSHGIPTEFPPKVQKQAWRIPDHVLGGDYAGRLDLRSWTIVTIDGEDAKDLDDGVSLTWMRRDTIWGFTLPM